MSRAPVRVETVEIYPAAVLRGDVVPVGSRPLIVVARTHLDGGAVRLHFVSGERLSVHRGTTLTVLRADPPGLRPRSFWDDAAHHRDDRTTSRAEIWAPVLAGCALVVALATFLTLG
ncbi:hypothetical protein [Streptomyces sp. NPDC127098]|uniref:hypothetical protein n=1 Tax=Streptomyces sp. NPDC127098 TaxID=3347137 RepID=UPI003655D4FA